MNRIASYVNFDSLYGRERGAIKPPADWRPRHFVARFRATIKINSYLSTLHMRHAIVFELFGTR